MGSKKWDCAARSISKTGKKSFSGEPRKQPPVNFQVLWSEKLAVCSFSRAPCQGCSMTGTSHLIVKIEDLAHRDHRDS